MDLVLYQFKSYLVARRSTTARSKDWFFASDLI